MKKFFKRNDVWLIPLAAIVSVTLLAMSLPWVAYAADVYFTWTIRYLWP